MNGIQLSQTDIARKIQSTLNTYGEAGVQALCHHAHPQIRAAASAYFARQRKTR